MSALRICILIFLFSLSNVAAAQETDSLLIAPADSLVSQDSLKAPVDSTAQIQRPDSSEVDPRLLIPVTFFDEIQGLAIGDTLPIRHPALDPQEMLGEITSTFLYDFGTSGWPDGWSPFGINPNSIGLAFNDIPYRNPTSGLPAYDLLPFTSLQPLHLQPGRFGSPVGVNARLRAYDQPRSLTDIRYRSSNTGLSSVLVSHSQTRRLNLLNRPGLLRLLLAYGGHGANGEYAGSKLEGARQLLARIRLQNNLGSIEILNLHNRRRLGAHAGVTPGNSSNFQNIYNRILAGVINEQAQRQKIRNDLSLTVRRSLFGLSDPLTAAGYWTANTFRYVNNDTLQARTTTFGYTLTQSVPVNKTNLTFRIEGWTDQLRKDNQDSTSMINALPDSLGISRSEFHASVHTSLSWNNLHINATPGFHNTGTMSGLGGELDVRLDAGAFYLFAAGASTLSPVSWISEFGWGDSVVPLNELPASKATLLRAGIGLEWKAIDLAVSTFSQKTDAPTDFIFNASQDSLIAIAPSSAISWQGYSADFGFRRHAKRGWYLTASSTIFDATTPNTVNHYLSIIQQLPETYTQGRLGMRYRIFQGDLDFDLYARGRLWSSFLGRTLHPETGLLVLRDASARPIESSAALDVILEAKIRTAKLFVGFENLLSGTTLIIGNMLVPDYPLPQQRFRFGVHWPIWN